MASRLSVCSLLSPSRANQAREKQFFFLSIPFLALIASNFYAGSSLQAGERRQSSSAPNCNIHFSSTTGDKTENMSRKFTSNRLMIEVDYGRLSAPLSRSGLLAIQTRPEHDWRRSYWSTV